VICCRCDAEAPVLKTCRWRSPARGERTFALCDGCWLQLSGAVWIVPGAVRCFGTCRACGSWFALAELSDLAPGGKWDAVSGVCGACAR
jgi:hypothetical protein